jgi:hypothetical protein
MPSPDPKALAARRKTIFREIKLEKVLESNVKGYSTGNQVINVDIKTSRIKKLSKITEDLLKEQEVKSKMQEFLSQKQKLFQKWYLSPRQFSN